MYGDFRAADRSWSVRLQHLSWSPVELLKKSSEISQFTVSVCSSVVRARSDGWHTGRRCKPEEGSVLTSHVRWIFIRICCHHNLFPPTASYSTTKLQGGDWCDRSVTLRVPRPAFVLLIPTFSVVRTCQTQTSTTPLQLKKEEGGDRVDKENGNAKVWKSNKKNPV